MSNNNYLLTPEEASTDESANQFDDTTTPSENGFSKIAIGILIGAALGGIAGALTNRSTVNRVNQTVKNAGNSVKGAAVSISEAVKEVGNAVNSVAVGVNETVRDVGSGITGAADEVTETVETTVSAVKDTSDGINATMKTTVGAVQKTVATIQQPDALRSSEQADAQTSAQTEPTEQIATASDGETLYRLVPVAQDTSPK
ncbi:MAG: hypothetical protein KME13_14280 [Myxacorys californica WJT36-NPBG1]|jgi:phage-related protein|nr:hypothetical protein [Myxacorys californica WJT36-NPBG1]